MADSVEWDWETGEKLVADINEWSALYNWVEEPYVSPSGEKIAAIVNVGEGEFNVCLNGSIWERDANFEKAWYLRFSPDGRLTALVSDDMVWTIAVDGRTWENSFDYIWNTIFSKNGSHIAVSSQQEGKYCMVLDDTPWGKTFGHMACMVLSSDGEKTAAAVQTVDLGEGEIFKFQEGAFSAAANGKSWEKNFVNVWNMAFSPDGSKLAAEVRLNLYDYTIAVNGVPWDKTFGCVWEPVFHPFKGTVLAPVKAAGSWTMAEDGTIIWPSGFVQVWHQMVSPDGSKLAAIVASSFGKWTVAVDGKPWDISFGDLVTDAVFSPDSNKIAAVAKDDDSYTIVVNETVWDDKFDMAWKPVFSPDSQYVAAKVEKSGKYTIAVNGKCWSRICDMAWDPVFSPDGASILCRSIENGKYYRRVIPIDEMQQ